MNPELAQLIINHDRLVSENKHLLEAITRAHGHLVTKFQGAYTPEILGAIAILSDALLEYGAEQSLS